MSTAQPILEDRHRQRRRGHLRLMPVTASGTDQTDGRQQQVAAAGERERESLALRVAAGAVRLAQGELDSARRVLAPALAESARVTAPRWAMQALILQAIASDQLGDEAARADALEHALDLAEPNGALLAFLLHPAPQLLERHRTSFATAHAPLISEILTLIASSEPKRSSNPAGGLPEQVTESELRVLRYLPTNLSKREIAQELFISVHTVKTHIHHLYSKLGAHGRSEAVERARCLGLLAPSPRP